MSKFRRIAIVIAFSAVSACASAVMVDDKATPELTEPVSFGMLQVEKNGNDRTQNCFAQFVDSTGKKVVIKPMSGILALHLPPGPARLDELLCGGQVIGFEDGEFSVPSDGSNVYFGSLKLIWKTRFDHRPSTVATPPFSVVICVLGSDRCTSPKEGDNDTTVVPKLENLVETARMKLMLTYPNLRDHDTTKSILSPVKRMTSTGH